MLNNKTYSLEGEFSAVLQAVQKVQSRLEHLEAEDYDIDLRIEVRKDKREFLLRPQETIQSRMKQ